MFIQSKRGRTGRGFSLKNPHGSANGWLVYVWDSRTYNAEQVKKVRTLKGNSDYSKVSGWRSLGKYDDPSTFEKYYEHIINVYGKEISRKDAQEELERKYHEHEAKRIEELNKKNAELLRESHLKGFKDVKLADSIREAKRRISQLQNL